MDCCCNSPTRPIAEFIGWLPPAVSEKDRTTEQNSNMRLVIQNPVSKYLFSTTPTTKMCHSLCFLCSRPPGLFYYHIMNCKCYYIYCTLNSDATSESTSAMCKQLISKESIKITHPHYVGLPRCPDRSGNVKELIKYHQRHLRQLIGK